MPMTLSLRSAARACPQSDRRSPLRTIAAAQPAPPPAARLDLVTTRAGFDALEPSWNDLFQRAGRNIHLFQTFNWNWHWANHFLDEAERTLAIVTAHSGDRLVMVWPLVLERAGPIRELRWMGDPVSQYGDALIDEAAGAAGLLRAGLDFAVHETGASVLTLRKVRADSNVAPLLADIGAKVTAELTAPYLDLSSAPSFAEYEKRYSGGARRNRKRQRRRLADRGAVVLAWHTAGAEAEALAADAFRLKRRWLDERGIVSPALVDPRTARFFADATRADVRPAGCHAIALSCGGRTVTLEIGVRAKGRTAIHVITYDLDFEKTGAGSLLMEDSVARAIDDGMTVFDLLAPRDGYKLEWADDAVVVRDWAKPLSLVGRLYAGIYLGLVKRAAKRGLDALPVSVRRAIGRGLGRQAG